MRWPVAESSGVVLLHGRGAMSTGTHIAEAGASEGDSTEHAERQGNSRALICQEWPSCQVGGRPYSLLGPPVGPCRLSPSLLLWRTCTAGGMCLALGIAALASHQALALQRSSRPAGIARELWPRSSSFCCADFSKAACLACKSGRSLLDFCRAGSNSHLDGCAEELAWKHGEGLRRIKMGQPSPCCTSRTARCLACASGQSLEDFCVDVRNADVLGCAGYCGLIEDGYDYPGDSLRVVNYLPDADACCATCRAERRCTSWTWEKGAGSPTYGRCSLKRPLSLSRERSPNFTAGLPGHDRFSYQVRGDSGFCLEVLGDQLSLTRCRVVAQAPQQRWSMNRMRYWVRWSGGQCLDAGDTRMGKVAMVACNVRAKSQVWDYSSSTGRLESAGRCLEIQEGGGLAMAACERGMYPPQRWTFWNGEALGQASAMAAILKGSGAIGSPSGDSKGDARLGEEQTARAMIEAAAMSSTTATSTQTETVAAITTGIGTTTRTSHTATQTPTTTIVSTATRTATSTPTQIGTNIALFCFSVMLPWGYEPALLAMQYRSNFGIFACNSWAVYSNATAEGLGGLEPTVLDVDLHCKKKGIFHTFYNTPIFVKIWQAVVADDRVRASDWVVKADPDAVLLPARLRGFLRNHGDMLLERAASNAGVFINNCKFGLHGPFELVSRRGLEVYAQYRVICETDPKRPPQEDAYLQRCLKKLGVQQIDDFNLMVEDHCQPPPGWQSCRSGHAVFHPFKTPQLYQQCISNAETFHASEGPDFFARH